MTWPSKVLASKLRSRQGDRLGEPEDSAGGPHAQLLLRGEKGAAEKRRNEETGDGLQTRLALLVLPPPPPWQGRLRPMRRRVFFVHLSTTSCYMLMHSHAHQNSTPTWCYRDNMHLPCTRILLNKQTLGSNMCVIFSCACFNFNFMTSKRIASTQLSNIVRGQTQGTGVQLGSMSGD